MMQYAGLTLYDPCQLPHGSWNSGPSLKLFVGSKGGPGVSSPLSEILTRSPLISNYVFWRARDWVVSSPGKCLPASLLGQDKTFGGVRTLGSDPIHICSLSVMSQEFAVHLQAPWVKHKFSMVRRGQNMASLPSLAGGGFSHLHSRVLYFHLLKCKL